MSIAQSKKKRPRASEMVFELIGGIYLVEKFKDGTETREEIDGEVVLKMLLQVVSDYAENVISQDKYKKKQLKS